MKPSEYWYRQCYATFQSDPVGMEMVSHLGEDNIMWGSDFPTEHWLGEKCSYVLHLQLILEALELSAGEREAILGGTPMRIWFG